MTPLHTIGNFVRELMLQIPLGTVRVLFVSVLVGLLVWVLRLPREMTTPAEEITGWSSNLKLGAGIALGIQILIYSFV